MSGEGSMRMRAVDAAWLRMGGPPNPMVISALVRFDDALEIDALAELLQRRLVDAYPKFAMRIRAGSLPVLGSLPAVGPMGGGLRWERDRYFAIGRHIHHVALPVPGGETALRALIGDLVSTPLPEDRPLWQAHLIECGGADTALLIRMHHCIADGIALAKVLLSLTDGLEGVRALDADTEPSRRPSRSVSRTTQVSAAAHRGIDALLHPRSALTLAREGVRDAEVIVRLLMHPSDPGALKGPLSGVRRVGWSPPIDLELIKAIAHGNDATVNDVLLAAVAGALRWELPSDGRSRLRITAIIPFNLRPPHEPVPRELGNQFGLVFLDMPVSESLRRDRLASVKRQMEQIKHSPEGPVTYAVLQAMGLAPAEVESRLVGFFSSKGSAVITNVPGPREGRTFAGARVRDLEIWAPPSGSVGMSVSLFSYRGQVTVGLLSDVAVLSDPQRVARRVAVEMKALSRLEPARRAA